MSAAKGVCWLQKSHCFVRINLQSIFGKGQFPKNVSTPFQIPPWPSQQAQSLQPQLQRQLQCQRHLPPPPLKSLVKLKPKPRPLRSPTPNMSRPHRHQPQRSPKKFQAQSHIPHPQISPQSQLHQKPFPVLQHFQVSVFRTLRRDEERDAWGGQP